MIPRFHLEAAVSGRTEARTLCGKSTPAYNVVTVIAPHDETCTSCLTALADIRKQESEKKDRYFNVMVIGVMLDFL